MSYGVNAPWGLKPVGYLNGTPYNGAVREYPILDNYGTAIYKYDPVISLNDGSIGIGVAGSPVRGIFMGVKDTGTDGVFYHKPFWAASTRTLGGSDAMALILDDPNIVMDVQETNGSGAAGTALNKADINLNANFYVQAGNATTGISKVTVSNASENTTATLNLKILGLSPHRDNLALGVTYSAGVSFANWLCAWNTHELKSVGTSGV